MLCNINDRITISIVRLSIALLKFVEISELLFFCKGISYSSYWRAYLSCCLRYYNRRLLWNWRRRYIIVFGLSYCRRRSRAISQLSWSVLLIYRLMWLVSYLKILLNSSWVILTWCVLIRKIVFLWNVALDILIIYQLKVRDFLLPSTSWGKWLSCRSRTFWTAMIRAMNRRFCFICT